MKVGNYEYGFTKCGTIESIIKTAYNGVDKYEVLTGFGQSFFIGFFAKGIISNGLHFLYGN